LPDENAHAPNEKLDLGNFHHGIIAAAYLYNEIAQVAVAATNPGEPGGASEPAKASD